MKLGLPPDALDRGGFMAFRLARRIRIVRLTVPV